VTYEDDEEVRRAFNEGLHRQEPPPGTNGQANGEARGAESWSPPPEQPWPAPLAEEAFHGLVGEIVRKIEPETEADPAALLFQFHAGIGNVLGTGSYVRVEADRQLS
jgi:hypothetical protein